MLPDEALLGALVADVLASPALVLAAVALLETLVEEVFASPALVLASVALLKL